MIPEIVRCAAIVDNFGLMGAMVKSITPARASGLALMAAGVLLTQRS
jgi:uncharacterized membrane protein YdcZ (DUF606 family)